MKLSKLHEDLGKAAPIKKVAPKPMPAKKNTKKRNTKKKPHTPTRDAIRRKVEVDTHPAGEDLKRIKRDMHKP